MDYARALIQDREVVLGENFHWAVLVADDDLHFNQAGSGVKDLRPRLRGKARPSAAGLPATRSGTWAQRITATIESKFIMQFLHESLIELITQTSTNLPPDVREAMGLAVAHGDAATRSRRRRCSIIATNIDMAAEDEGPICQDTGMPTFDVHTPVGVNQIGIKKAIRAAVAEATQRGKLRPNSVDSLTGKNSGDNLGVGTPIIHFEQWEHDEIEVKLILKGGGCENKNIQYSLPCELEHLGQAGRNLEGVRKCILHAVWQAQGQGCAPGALGVCIGSDRAHGYLLAKYQLFRTLDDVNPDAGAGQARSRNHGGGQPPRRRARWASAARRR